MPSFHMVEAVAWAWALSCLFTDTYYAFPMTALMRSSQACLTERCGSCLWWHLSLRQDMSCSLHLIFKYIQAHFHLQKSAMPGRGHCQGEYISALRMELKSPASFPSKRLFSQRIVWSPAQAWSPDVICLEWAQLYHVAGRMTVAFDFLLT